MKPTKRAIADGESASGSVNVISRLGDIVFRPMGLVLTLALKKKN